MVTLIARLDVETAHWVGTSLGGLIGLRSPRCRTARSSGSCSTKPGRW